MESEIFKVLERTVPISAFSKGQGAKVFNDVHDNNHDYIVMKNNRPAAVLVSLENYRKLVDSAEKLDALLESVNDSLLFEQAKSRVSSIDKAVPFEEVLARDGLAVEDLKSLPDVEIEVEPLIGRPHYEVIAEEEDSMITAVRAYEQEQKKPEENK